MKAVILTGGDWPEAQRIQNAILGADAILCCDGAAQRALKYGLVPDVLVGDMDSITKQALAQLQCGSVAIKQLPCRKDMTDTFEACDIALEKGATHVVLIGGFGQRMDHSLGNVHCLMHLCTQGAFTQVESGDVTAYAIRGKLTLHGQQGKTFSLIPLLPHTRIARLTGASYPLQDAALPMEQTLGISNIAVHEELYVDVDGGMALLILNHTLPK